MDITHLSAQLMVYVHLAVKADCIKGRQILKMAIDFNSLHKMVHA